MDKIMVEGDNYVLDEEQVDEILDEGDVYLQDAFRIGDAD